MERYHTFLAELGCQGIWGYFSHTIRKYQKLWFLIVCFVFQQFDRTCPTPIRHHRKS
jgi:hypothetical protein